MKLMELLQLLEESKATVLDICHRAENDGLAAEVMSGINAIIDEVHELLGTGIEQPMAEILNRPTGDSKQMFDDAASLTTVSAAIDAHPDRVVGVNNKFGNPNATHVMSDDYLKLKADAVAAIGALKDSVMESYRAEEAKTIKVSAKSVVDEEEPKKQEVPIPAISEIAHPNSPEAAADVSDTKSEVSVSTAATAEMPEEDDEETKLQAEIDAEELDAKNKKAALAQKKAAKTASLTEQKPDASVPPSLN